MSTPKNSVKKIFPSEKEREERKEEKKARK